MASAGRLCILDQNACILAVNNSFCQTLLYNPTDFLQLPFQEFVHEQDISYFLEAIQKPICENLLLLIRKKDDTYQNYYWHHKILENNIQASISTEFLFTDTHTKFSQQSSTLDTILNKQVLDDGVWDWDLEKETIYYSPRWKEIIGYTDEELYNDLTTWQNHIYEEDLQATLALIEAYNTGKVANFELTQRFYHKDNSTIYLYCRATHFKNEEGKVVRMVGVVNDITKIKLAEDKQRKSERILSKAQEIVKMGSWEWDKMEDKIIWSAQLYKLLGFEVDEFVPVLESLLEHIHPTDKSRVMTTAWQYLQNRTTETIECKAVKKDKEVIWVKCEGYIEYDSSNLIIRVIGVVVDITEQKKNEQDLIDAKEMAEASVKTKEQFISTMSHEIRTPMNAVIGMTNLLLQENPQNYQIEYLNVLQSAAKNLLLLINDILDFSKIEAGKVVFETIDFDLQEVLHNLVNIYLYTAKEKGLSLTAEMDKQINFLLLGDSTKLIQILTNFISNAIKFTEKGEIKILVKLIENEDKQAKIQFSVIDSGIGISKDRIEHIFESFTQATVDTTRKYGGTGLGLTIARNLIELQGGKVEVESKVDIGSTFQFSLVFPKSKLPFKDFLPQKANAFETTSLEGINILIAEDNEANRFVISRFLTNWKISYTFAVNGKEVVAKIQEKPYHMILMDLHMPELDGYEATKIIRKLPNTFYQTIPIVALTASVLSSVKHKLKEIGIDDFLMKPFDPKDLYQIIAKYTSNNQHIQHIFKESLPKEQIEISKNTIESINFSQFDKITMGDKIFGRELLQLYLKQFVEYIVELHSLLGTQPQADAIHSLHHKIKSTITILELQNSLYQEQLILEQFIKEYNLVAIQQQFYQIENLCNVIKVFLVEKLALLSE
jgi:PAS domain S-box-containing protein